jgi:hypothetical protein
MKTLKAFVGTLTAALALSLGAAGAAQAQAPVPTGDTPGMIGGQTIGAGRMVIGAATGYPETQFRIMWGMGSNFDLGINAGLTYGARGVRRHQISGLRQQVGLDLQVPLRWTLFNLPKAAMALRIVPFFRIGQYDPSVSVGGIAGVRFSIALPKIFSLIVGAETRADFASVGSGDSRFNFFDGATYAVIGLESYFKDAWFFNLEMDIGGAYASKNIGGDPLYNILFGFGYAFN